MYESVLMRACHKAILSPPPLLILTVFGLMTLLVTQAIQHRTSKD